MVLTVRKVATESMRTSRLTRHRLAGEGRQGFSLMEVLVVLVIFALATSVAMPSMSRMLDQTMSHAVFFEFQRQISDLRREASRTGLPITVADLEVAGRRADDDEPVRTLNLRQDWTYSLSPSLLIEAGGRCGSTSVRLMHQERMVMKLETEDGTCRFTQYRFDPAQEALSRP